MQNPHPASQFLRETMAAWPQAARLADHLRHEPEESWPAWCFLPCSGTSAIITAGKPVGYQPTLEEAGQLMPLAAALAWRPGQDIARFDAEMYKALLGTPLDKTLPEGLLYRLPAWCIYFEVDDSVYHGFFAFLEHDLTDGRAELRCYFLGHKGQRHMPISMHLGHGSISAGLAAFQAEVFRQADARSINAQALEQLSGADWMVWRMEQERLLRLALPLVLYLCSAEPEYSPQPDGSREPGMPSPKKVKGGWRIFPPDRPKIWEVGRETGIRIRAARSDGQGQHSGPRPHIRRAHWHTFWTGRRKFAEGETPVPQTAQAKWLPPIAVGMQEDDDD